MATAKLFKSAINRTFASKGGVLWETVSDSQLCQYMMRATEDFFAQPAEDLKMLNAAITLGKQSAHDIYVMGEIQFDQHGRVIPQEAQKYVWMIPHLAGVPIAPMDTLLKEYLKVSPLTIEVPLGQFSWSLFINAAKLFTKNNFSQFLLLLAGAISAFHYEKVLAIVGSCPAPMAVGEPASGKSTCLRLIHQLIGGTFISQSSVESVSTELIRSTLPVYWDDPSHPNTLRNVLVSTFQGGGKQTKSGGNEVPRTTFLLTVNFKLDNDLRSFERTTPIFFEKIVNDNSENDFFSTRKTVFQLAESHTCLPSIIRMGNVTETDLKEHVQFFQEKLQGLPKRLPQVYCVYRYFAFKIIELVGDDTIISQKQLDSHLKENLVPYVKELYKQSKKVKATLGSLCEDLVNAVKKGYSAEHVSKWLRPNIPQRQFPFGPAVHINRQKLTAALHAAGTPYTSQDLKTATAEVEGCDVNFRTSFEEKCPRVPSVKIPREAVSTAILKEIDSWFDMDQVDDQSPESESDGEEQSKTCRDCEISNKVIQELRTEKEIFKTIEDDYLSEIEKLKDRLIAESQKVDRLEEELSSAKAVIRNLESKNQAGLTDVTVAKDRNSPAVANVVQSLNMIVASTPSTTMESDSDEPGSTATRSLNDSGFLDESENYQVSDGRGVKRKKKTQEDKNHCNLCRSRKQSSMIKCNDCQQWLHSKCANINLKDYDSAYQCTCCQKASHT